eukprot:Amastigsp_a509135_677.p3 type:complete len:142 gc:universal Amastigsp_a509135_677:821-396(-)
MRLDEKRLGQRHAHAPPAREVAQRARLHLLVETETVQNLTCPARGCARLELLDRLVDVVEASRVGALGLDEKVGLGLELRGLGLEILDHELDRVLARRLRLVLEEIDVYVLVDRNLAVGQNLEERRLASAVLSKEPVAVAV